MEAYAAYEVTAFGWQGKLILLVVAVYILYVAVKQIRAKKSINKG